VVLSFSQSSRSGDWQRIGVSFQPQFPAPASGLIRVFATATCAGLSPGERGAPAVPVVGEISPRGFTIWARNSDIVPGRAAFNWIAVAEMAEPPLADNAALFGLLSPQYFMTSAQTGDWSTYGAPIPVPLQLPSSPVVVASASNANVRVHATAAVPVVDSPTLDRVSLQARNSDVGAGLASVGYVAMLPGEAAPDTLAIDSGRVAPLRFAPGARRGDWQTWGVTFAAHFVGPPVVIATADNYDGNLRSYAVAAVGMADDVTPYGFTLAARNSDVSGGFVAFSWLAIGYIPA
jgi:hypothetical protein